MIDDDADDTAPIWMRFRSERLPSGRHIVFANARIGGEEHQLQLECQNPAYGQNRLQEQIAEIAVAHERAKLGAMDEFDAQVTKADRGARRKARLSYGST